MEQGSGVNELLFIEAEALADESRRLHKALQLGRRGYSVNEAAVRDHVNKAMQIASRMHERLNPTPAGEPVVSDAMEYAVAPRVATREALKSPRHFEQTMSKLADQFKAGGEKLEVIGVDLAAGVGKVTTPTVPNREQTPRRIRGKK
jgi:hypothetical protein